jgi:hypothetical protein
VNSLYYGEWSTKLNKAHGRGIIVWKNCRYEGYFKNGLFNIRGRLYNKNRNFYDAEFFCDKVHGYGSKLYNSGVTYIGYFKNGLQEGKGKETYSNGGCYKEHFKNWKRHGLGRYKYHNRDIYEAQFLNDMRNGKG